MTKEPVTLPELGAAMKDLGQAYGEDLEEQRIVKERLDAKNYQIVHIDDLDEVIKQNYAYELAKKSVWCKVEIIDHVLVIHSVHIEELP